MADVEIECKVPGCSKIVKQKADLAIEYLKLHHKQVHEGPTTVHSGGGGQSTYEKMKHPTISAGLSLKDFKFFL